MIAVRHLPPGASNSRLGIRAKLVETRLRMKNEHIKEEIAGGLRTLVQFVPILGGAAAQAWSEYEGIQRNARVDGFFTELGTRVRSLEELFPEIVSKIRAMHDFARLLEDTVCAIQRESNERKRAMYPGFFLNLILQSDRLPENDRQFLIESLDTLTGADFSLLQKFRGNAWVTGEVLSDTVGVQWGSVGPSNPVHKQYEDTLQPVMISTAKLEARGIIVQQTAPMTFDGGPSEWYMQYRSRAWMLMPMGKALLELLESV